MRAAFRRHGHDAAVHPLVAALRLRFAPLPDIPRGSSAGPSRATKGSSGTPSHGTGTGIMGCLPATDKLPASSCTRHGSLVRASKRQFTLLAVHGKRVADKLGIAGQRMHALFLGLYKQQLVEWVFVPKRLCKFGGGQARVHDGRWPLCRNSCRTLPAPGPIRQRGGHAGSRDALPLSLRRCRGEPGPWRIPCCMAVSTITP